MATADVKTGKGITLNTKYEAAPKKYQLGATWNGTVSDRTTAVKVCLCVRAEGHYPALRLRVCVYFALIP